jgi:hypothetical protein
VDLQSQTGLVARVDLSFGNALARRYDGPVGTATFRADTDEDPLYLAYSPFDFQTGEAGIVLLDAELASLSECDPFAAAAMNIVNPGWVAANLSVTLEDAVVTVSDGVTMMAPADIPLGVMGLAKEDLCEGGVTILPPVLSLVPGGIGDGHHLEFASQLGVSYDIQFTANLETAFGTIDTVPGTGELIRYPLGVLDNGSGFYRVQARLTP